MTFSQRGEQDDADAPGLNASSLTLLAGAMVVAAGIPAVADDKVMQPTEGKKGATILGPRDPARANENPDQRFTNCQTPERITALQLQL